MTPDEQIDLYRLARSIAWSYQLQTYDAAALKDMQKVVEKAKVSIVQEISDRLTVEQVTKGNLQDRLMELDRLTLGLQSVLAAQLVSGASRIGVEALKEWAENMSVGGISNIVNTVALSPEQFRAFFTDNPPGGLLIPKAMKNAIAQGVIAPVENEILSALQEGALTGKSYKRIVDTLEDSFTNFTRNQLTALTRTFFQTANAQAFEMVHEANKDIVEGRIWTNVNDDRVCMLCLPLGGNFYKNGEAHPPMIRHPNCRCVFRSKTVTWRSLGIDLPELEEVASPVVLRGKEVNGKWVVPAVGTGAGKRPRSVSFYKNGMKEAFPDMPESLKLELIGKTRLRLFNEGKLKIEEMVNRNTGRLWLIDELEKGLHRK